MGNDGQISSLDMKCFSGDWEHVGHDRDDRIRERSLRGACRLSEEALRLHI